MEPKGPQQTEADEGAIPRKIARLLLVEDDRRLAEELFQELSELAETVRCCVGVSDGVSALREWRPQFLVLDIKLADGNAVELLEQCADLSPRPTVISISGAADPAETFRLGQLGVREFVHKPLRPGELKRAIERVILTPPDLRPHVKNLLGHVGLKEAEQTVRETMVSEALERSAGNRRGAARLLWLTRQALQHIIRRR